MLDHRCSQVEKTSQERRCISKTSFQNHKQVQKKNDLFRDLGARAWISPYISEAYLKNINKCFRIFRMFSATSNTQKKTNKTSKFHRLFFGNQEAAQQGISECCHIPSFAKDSRKLPDFFNHRHSHTLLDRENF